MPANHPHVTTWAGRKFYGKPVAIPANATSTTVSDRAGLDAALQGSAQVIYVSGPITGDTVMITDDHSTAAGRFIVATSPGASLSRLWFFGASNWTITAQNTNWVDIQSGSSQYRHTNNVTYYANSLAFVDTTNIVLDRWRYMHYDGMVSYYSTDGGLVKDLWVQRGIHKTPATVSPKEGVLISRRAWCGEMIGGTSPVASSHKWHVQSEGVRIVNNVSIDPNDFYQNTGNGHVPGQDGTPLWAWGRQTGALSLDDRDLLIAGNQCVVTQYIFDSFGLPIRCRVSETFVDLKNGSSRADKPVVVEDNVVVGWAPSIGHGDAKGIATPDGVLEDPGSAGVGHYEDTDNVVVRLNVFVGCNRGFTSGKGSKNVAVDDNLFYNGPATLGGTELPRHADAVGQNADPGAILLQDQHPDTQINRAHRNHIIQCRTAYLNNTRNGGPAASISGDVVLSSGDAALSSSGTLTMQLRDPDNLDDPTATVDLVMPQALIAANDSPTADNVWLLDNEAPPGSGAGFVAFGATLSTDAEQVTVSVSATGGTEPYSFQITSIDDPTASASIDGEAVTVVRGDGYRTVTVSVEATDDDGDSATARVQVVFARPEIPDQTWTASDVYNGDPNVVLKDGDTSLDGGWTGRTLDGNPVVVQGTWPVAHDIDLIRVVQGLQSGRTYYRQWYYLPEGGDANVDADWVLIEALGTQSANLPEKEWAEHAELIEGVIGLRYVGTGNSDGNQWHRIQEVEVFGTPSEEPLTAPVCSLGALSLAQGERRTFALAELGTLAASGGGDSLTVNADSVRVVPAEAGTAQWIGGELDVRASETYAGTIRVEYELVATGEA